VFKDLGADLLPAMLFLAIELCATERLPESSVLTLRIG